MEDHSLGPRRSGDFTTSRRSTAQEDILFILEKARRGVPWPAIAQMVGRPVEDVKAAFRIHSLARMPRRDRPAKARAAEEPKPRSKNVRPRPMPKRVVEIAARVAADHGCTLAELAGTRGSDSAQAARQAAYFEVRGLVKENGKPRFSYALIGAFFGGRDHTTVLHGVKAHLARIAIQAPGARLAA